MLKKNWVQSFSSYLGVLEKWYAEAAVCRCSSEQVLLKISQYSQKIPVLEFLFSKVAGLYNFVNSNFMKKRLQYRCFPINIAKFVRIVFFHRTPFVAASGYESIMMFRLCVGDHDEEVTPF